MISGRSRHFTHLGADVSVCDSCLSISSGSTPLLVFLSSLGVWVHQSVPCGLVITSGVMMLRALFCRDSSSSDCSIGMHLFHMYTEQAYSRTGQTDGGRNYIGMKYVFGIPPGPLKEA